MKEYRDPHRITPKQVEKYKNELYFVWIHDENGKYRGYVEHANAIKVTEVIQECLLVGNQCVVWTMQAYRRFPVLPADRKLDTTTYRFKFLVAPLLYDDSELVEGRIPWKRVVEYVNMRGYYEERPDYSGAIEIGSKVIDI
ncbi:hypothetical protein J1TS5_25430 [Paenibacillus macerans]|uniref:hypothetical protein n=1 Tax=Paenibacillus macerans TaxID=44252 RepID=UPI001AFF86CB|nr:hypothetical protein [Paenibacillus macerans]GIP10373.1 hypothetical protein J1TS5_25430 [Paenibacillus macerans]